MSVYADEAVWEKIAEVHSELVHAGIDPVQGLIFADEFNEAPNDYLQEKVAAEWEEWDAGDIDKIAEAVNYLSDIEGIHMVDLMESYDKEAGWLRNTRKAVKSGWNSAKREGRLMTGRGTHSDLKHEARSLKREKLDKMSDAEIKMHYEEKREAARTHSKRLRKKATGNGTIAERKAYLAEAKEVSKKGRFDRDMEARQARNTDLRASEQAATERRARLAARGKELGGKTFDGLKSGGKKAGSAFMSGARALGNGVKKVDKAMGDIVTNHEKKVARKKLIRNAKIGAGVGAVGTGAYVTADHFSS